MSGDSTAIHATVTAPTNAANAHSDALATAKRKWQGSDANTDSPSLAPRNRALDLETSASTSAIAAAAESPLPSPSSSAAGFHSVGGAKNGSFSSALPRTISKAAQKRNIDRVQFGQYDIKTWYYSPYQFDEEEWASLSGKNANDTSSSQQPSTLSGKYPRSSKSSSNLAAQSNGSLTDAHPKAGAAHTNGDHLSSLESSTDQAHSPASRAAPSDEPLAKSIWICDGCFKYVRTYSGFRAHKRSCPHSHPPGRKVYQRGAHTIWEVDGAREKLYGQNLSLFGKLFIDHKTIFFDVEPFMFYVLTDATSSFDHVLGYFSKEKNSYDDYNLACIITFPPYQKSGFGTLMIEFSYYISSLTAVLGTPERPLSDLGLKGYLSFWTGVVLRTIALVFNEQDEDIRARLLPSTFTAPTKGRHRAQTTANNAAAMAERQRAECVRLRRIIFDLPRLPVAGAQTRAGESLANPGTKGWAGEVPRKRQRGRGSSASIGEAANESSSRSMELRSAAVDPVSDATLHPSLDLDGDGGQIDDFTTTLARLAEATNLRIEDLCFALSECQLLRQVTTKKVDAYEEPKAVSDMSSAAAATPTTLPRDDSQPQKPPSAPAMELLISRLDVCQTIKTLNVKRPVMDVLYALI